jgi:hypothetical protein
MKLRQHRADAVRLAAGAERTAREMPANFLQARGRVEVSGGSGPHHSRAGRPFSPVSIPVSARYPASVISKTRLRTAGTGGLGAAVGGFGGIEDAILSGCFNITEEVPATLRYCLHQYAVIH